jgi:hypothetical protein
VTEFCAATTDEPGLAEKTRARAPDAWGQAILVPDKVRSPVSVKWDADATLVPGAATSGLTELPGPGPTLEKVDNVLVLVMDPTPKARGWSPGDPAVEQAVPEFPMAKTPAPKVALRRAFPVSSANRINSTRFIPEGMLPLGLW